MRYLTKLGAATGMAAIALGALQAPAALALPTEPVMRYCEWNGRYYKPGAEIEVRSPDGTVRRYRCDQDGTGKWERMSYTSSSSSYYYYRAAP